MEFIILEIVISLIGLLFAVYSYATWTNDYWEKLGVKGSIPSLFFGTFRDVVLRRKALHIKIQELYDAYKNEAYFGYFVGKTPILVAKDPDFIKHVLIKDFNAFSDRGLNANEVIDPLSPHLFNLGGQRWKVLRHKLTPVFTTGKLKHMFDLMLECGDNFEEYLKKQVAKNEVIECRDQAARYTTDVIGSCAFGIDTQSLSDEDSEFRKAGRKIFEASTARRIKTIVRQIAPSVFKFLRLRMHYPEVTNFFINSMKQTIELREKEQYVRNDFVDVLRNIPKNSAVDGFEWTDNLLTAQAFGFFAAGFETSSTTISFALWELARTPEVQEKLRQEVLEFDANNEGKITYETVNEMQYLDMVVRETLRKNPPLPFLVRQAKQDYVIPGTNITLPKGLRIQIPVFSIHHDPKYYPEPEIFDPERFSPEEKKARHPMAFLAFGEGPKNCIGARFGYYQIKVALIKVMKNFRVHPTTNVNEPYPVDKDTVILTPVGGIVLKFERLSA